MQMKFRIACGMVLGFALFFAPITASAAGPVVAEIAGQSYGEWSAAWWQWAFSWNAAESPLEAQGPVDCTAGQQGPVWFLAGMAPGDAPVVRSCWIPTDKALFFPILNSISVNKPHENLTVAEKRAELGGIFDDSEPGVLADLGLPGSRACDLQVVLDGKPVRGFVPIARVQSPPFRVETGDDPVLPNLVDDEAISDGFYVMLPGLAAGHHTLRIQGRICEFASQATHPEFGSVDVSYELTVVGRSRSKNDDEDDDEDECGGNGKGKKNVALIQSLYDAFAAGDGDTILALIDEDVIWIESEGIPYGGTFIGRDAVFEGVFGKIAAEWDDFTATVDSMFAADGNRVIVQQRDGGTFKTTGKSMLAPAVSIWTLNNQGRVILFEQVIDTQEVNSATIP